MLFSQLLATNPEIRTFFPKGLPTKDRWIDNLSLDERRLRYDDSLEEVRAYSLGIPEFFSTFPDSDLSILMEHDLLIFFSLLKGEWDIYGILMCCCYAAVVYDLDMGFVGSIFAIHLEKCFETGDFPIGFEPVRILAEACKENSQFDYLYHAYIAYIKDSSQLEECS